jgi:hypothetical protein
MILFVLTWEANRRFARQVANSPSITDAGLLELFAATKSELGISRSIRLIESGQVQSPAIMGLFRPTLLLPADVREKFDARELRFIFLHELAHLKRGDVIVQALIALLQIAHWFNPVLWLAFRRMRIDREPATDAMVLSRTGEEEKERYGLMLIKLLEHFNQRHSLPTLVGILEDKDQFKRRFALIARFTRGAYGWSVLGVLLIGILAVACLTKAKATETPSAPPEQSQTYLEVTYLQTPTAMAVFPGGGTIPNDYAKKLLQDPKNRATKISDVPLTVGVNTVKGKTPSGFDFTINLNWKGPLSSKAQDLNIKEEWLNTGNPATHVSYGIDFKPSLCKDESFLIAGPWKTRETSNLIINLFDGPSDPPQKADEDGGVKTTSATLPAAADKGADAQSPDTSANPGAASTSMTLARLVLALHDGAKSIPADHQRLQILKGFYGADGSWRDVAGILQKSVQNNSLKVSWQQPYTEIGGDPAYLQVKTLVVSYRLDGVEKLATFREENPPVGLQATIPPTPASTSNAPASAEPLTVRTFLLPPNSSLEHGIRSADSVRAWLTSQDIQFPPGSAITLIPEIDPDKLVMRNTPEQLDKVAYLINCEAQKALFPPEPVAPQMPSASIGSGNSGPSLAAPVTLTFTLVEVDEKTYTKEAEAMDSAVAKGNKEFFARQKDVFVGPEVKATYSSCKGWYSAGEVQSFVGSVTYDKLNGKSGTILQAEAIFLGVNADFAFSAGGTSVDTFWQLTEPEKTVSQKVPPLALAQSRPVTFSLRPTMHVTTFKDKNWGLVPGQIHSYWLGKTLGQITRTRQFRDMSHASIDEMVKNKVPSRVAVFVTAQ